MGFAAGFSAGFGAVQSTIEMYQKQKEREDKKLEEERKLALEQNEKKAKANLDTKANITNAQSNYIKERKSIMTDKNLSEEQKIDRVNELKDTMKNIYKANAGYAYQMGVLDNSYGQMISSIDVSDESTYTGADGTKYFGNKDLIDKITTEGDTAKVEADGTVKFKDMSTDEPKWVASGKLNKFYKDSEDTNDKTITISENTPKPILDKLEKEGFKVGDTIRTTVYDSYAKKGDSKYSIYNTATGAQYKMNRETGEMQMISNPKISSKTPTISMPDGSTAYADEEGNALVSKDGKIMYKNTSKTSQDITSAGATKKSLFAQLDLMGEAVKNNPNAVGSIGENFTDFIGNVANDILKIDTKDRETRERLDQFSGAIAAQLREMTGETGVMTESDFERYQKMMPDKNDSPKAYANKLKRLKEDLERKYGDQIRAFYGEKTEKAIKDKNKDKDKDELDSILGF